MRFQKARDTYGSQPLCFFLIFALSYFSGMEYSWYIGLAAVLVSQVLIIMYWKEAKFGSVQNLII